MNQFRQLMYLQDLEKEERLLRNKLDSLPQIIKLRQLKKEIEVEQQYLRGKKEELNLQRKKITSSEGYLEEERKELAVLAERLFSGEISNLKELESMALKKDSLGNQVKELEDNILIQMESLEQEKKRLTELNDKLKAKKEAFRDILADYNYEQEELKQGLALIPEEKSKLEAQIDKKILTDYNEKKSNYDNNYVVEIRNQTCQGCHMALPFDIVKTVRTDSYAKCDKCGRILI